MIGIIKNDWINWFITNQILNKLGKSKKSKQKSVLQQMYLQIDFKGSQIIFWSIHTLEN